jgi:hypothetical protein
VKKKKPQPDAKGNIFPENEMVESVFVDSRSFMLTTMGEVLEKLLQNGIKIGSATIG